LNPHILAIAILKQTSKRKTHASSTIDDIEL
jgi:hypothetical protein